MLDICPEYMNIINLIGDRADLRGTVLGRRDLWRPPQRSRSGPRRGTSSWWTTEACCQLIFSAFVATKVATSLDRRRKHTNSRIQMRQIFTPGSRERIVEIGIPHFTLGTLIKTNLSKSTMEDNLDFSGL